MSVPTAIDLRKAHSIDAHAAVSMDRNACDLSIPSAFSRKTTEHVVDRPKTPLGKIQVQAQLRGRMSRLSNRFRATLALPTRPLEGG
jgi:hypothetical protein